MAGLRWKAQITFTLEGTHRDGGPQAVARVYAAAHDSMKMAEMLCRASGGAITGIRFKAEGCTIVVFDSKAAEGKVIDVSELISKAGFDA